MLGEYKETWNEDNFLILKEQNEFLDSIPSHFNFPSFFLASIDSYNQHHFDTCFLNLLTIYSFLLDKFEGDEDTLERNNPIFSKYSFETFFKMFDDLNFVLFLIRTFQNPAIRFISIYCLKLFFDIPSPYLNNCFSHHKLLEAFISFLPTNLEYPDMSFLEILPSIQTLIQSHRDTHQNDYQNILLTLCERQLNNFLGLGKEQLYKDYILSVLDCIRMVLPSQLELDPQLSIIFDNIELLLQIHLQYNDNNSYQVLCFLSQILSLRSFEMDDDTLINIAHVLDVVEINSFNEQFMLIYIFTNLIKRNSQILLENNELLSLIEEIFSMATTGTPKTNFSDQHFIDDEHDMNYQLAKFISILFSSDALLESPDLFEMLQGSVNYDNLVVLLDSAKSQDSVIGLKALIALIGPPTISKHFWELGADKGIKIKTLGNIIFSALLNGSIEEKMVSLELFVKLLETRDPRFITIIFKDAEKNNLSDAYDSVLSLDDENLQMAAIDSLICLFDNNDFIYNSSELKHNFVAYLSQSDSSILEPLQDIMDDPEKSDELHQKTQDLYTRLQYTEVFEFY